MIRTLTGALLAGVLLMTQAVLAQAPPVIAAAAERPPPADPVAGANRLGLDMLAARLRQPEPAGNVALSPLNLARTLAILTAVGQGAEAADLRRRLGLPEGDDPQAFAAAFAGLAPMTTDGATLSLAEALWHAPELQPLPAVADLPTGAPRSLTRLADINDWVKARTQGRIAQLLDRLDPDTVLVLAGTLYFKADWTVPFPASDTAPGPFHLSDGKDVAVPLMQRTDRALPVRRNPDGAVGVFLTYRGGYGLTLILPPEGQSPASLLSGPDGLADEWLRPTDFTPTPTHLVLPRLDGLNVRTELAGETAPLPGLLPSRIDLGRSFAAAGPVPVSRAVHQVALSWDETGTVVAAGTAVAASRSGALLPPQEIRFDRPFLFVLQHGASGTLIAVGLVADPHG